MSRDVAAAYDAVAELYTSFAPDDFREATHDQTWIRRFAELALRRVGPTADLGCGPGHVTEFLRGLGLGAVGYDLSASFISGARARYPHLEFHEADITALDLPTASLGGIHARYSLIHMAPTQLGPTFEHWLPLLEPGGPLLVSFFAAASADDHGTPFDHRVTTGYALCTQTVAEQAGAAGFEVLDVGVRGPGEGERPLDHGSVLALKPAARSTGSERTRGVG